MNKNDLKNKIAELAKRDDSEQIEKLLEDELKIDPNNIDLWIRLAVLELRLPFHDEERAMECIEEVFKIERDNPIALLLKAYVQDRTLDKPDKNLTDKLSSLVTNSDEINSMLRFAAFWYYAAMGNMKKVEQLLKESINFYQGHMKNYLGLAILYFEDGRKQEAKELIRKGLKNVRKTYPIAEWEYDPTDVNELLYEFFNGLQLSKERFNDIREILNK